MQILFLPMGWTLALIFILWPVFQGLGAYVCHRLPDTVYRTDGPLFRSRSWEREGQIYQRIFRVRRWKNRLPESSRIIKGSFNKTSIGSLKPEHLRIYLIESCRAELLHWLGIPPFILFGFFVPLNVLMWMGVYALIFNVPFIIIQRFNRPRILAYLNKSLQRM